MASSYSAAPMMAHMRSSSSGPYAPSTVSPRIHGGVECGRESRADSISTLWSSADVPLFLDSRVSRMGGGSIAGSSRFSEVSTASGSFPWQLTSRGSGDSQAPQDQLIEELVQSYSSQRDSLSSMATPLQQQQQWLPRPSEASTRIPSLSLSNSDGSRQGSVSTPTAASFPAFQQSSPPTRLQKQRPTMLQLNGAPMHPPSRDINAPFMPVSVSYSSQLTFTGRSPTIAQTPLSASSKKSGGTQRSPLGSPLLSTPVADPGQLFHRRAETEPSPDILYSEAQRFFDPSYTMASPPPLPTPPAELADQQKQWTSPSQQRKSRRQRQSTATYATADSNEGTAESSMSSGSATSSCLPDSEPEDSGMAMLVLPAEKSHRPSTSPGEGGLAYLDRSQSVRSLTKAASPMTSPLRGIAARVGRYDSGPRPSTSDAVSASSSPRRAMARPANLYDLELDTSVSRDSASISSKRATLGARLRAVSTPKLRQAASGWRAQTADGTAPELPAKSIPAPDSATRTSSRGTSAYPPQAPSGRFRSRTVGEADRRSPSTPSSAPPPLPAGSRPSSTEIAARKLRRRSKDTLSSSFTSSAHSFLHTPFSSSSHLPTTPASQTTPAASTKSAARPKSKGGWASHLADGLTLHIEHEGRREVLRMSYLYYDPFGKPENLCASDATAQAAASSARPTTPSKRPKSKNGSRDSAEEQVGILEFGLCSVPGSPTALTFADRGAASAGPVLRHLTIGDDTKADLLTRQATLSLGQNGTHEVSGSERKGRLAWRFTFNIDDYEPGVKILRPVGFSCSATLLDPSRARKGGLLKSIRKQILVPNIVSVAVIGSPAASSVGLPDLMSSGATSDGRDSVSSSQPTMSRMGSFGDLHYNGQRAPSSASSTWSPASSKPAPLRGVPVPSNLPPGVVPFKMTRQGMSLSTRSNASLSSSANSRGASQPSTPASPASASSPGQQRSLMLPSPVSMHFNQHSPAPASRHLAAPASRRRGSSLGEASRADPHGSLGLTPGPEAVVNAAPVVSSEIVMQAQQPISPRQAIKQRLPAHLLDSARPSTGDAIAYHRPRAYTTASSRPQTASEEIKAAYLSRGDDPKILSSRSVSANVVPSANVRPTPHHARPYTADVLNVQQQPQQFAQSSSSPTRRGWNMAPERPSTLSAASRSTSSASAKKALPVTPTSAARQQAPSRPARDNSALLFHSLQEQGWM